MGKLNFHQPLLQSLELHDHSPIILICLFGAQETFLTSIILNTVVLLNIFVETMIHYFQVPFDKWKKNSIYLK